MSTYYEIKADIKLEDGTVRTELLFCSYDRKDCTYERDAEKGGWKEEGYKKIRIESREVDEKPDSEVYGDDIDPNTEEIREEDEESEEEEPLTEEEEETLEQARIEGYNVEGELERLFLDMEYANSYMIMVTYNMVRPFEHDSHKAAKVAYRAYWDAVDAQ